MSTRSNIVKVNEDETVEVIYCHNDGDLGFNGEILNEYYQDPVKVNELISLGAISSLGQYVETAPVLAQYGTDAFDKQYSFFHDKAKWDEIMNHTLAYHRDRGEELDIFTYDSLKDYFKNVNFDIEYVYVFKNNKWYYARPKQRGAGFTKLALLKTAIKKYEAEIA